MTKVALHQRPVVRLAVIAVVSLIVIWVLLRPSGHDANWWRRAGLRDRSGGGVERVVYSDDGSIIEANVHHGKGSFKHEDNIQILGGHENNLPVKRSDVVPATPVPAKARPVMRPLVQGVDYFADYDVANITLDPEPPLRPGQKVFFNYIDPATNTDYAMQYISNRPRVLAVQDFLTHAECDMLVEMASRKLFRSQVAPILNSKANAVNDVRTSSQAWLSANSPEVRPIVERLLRLTGMPQGSNEELQILRYDKSQKYDAHNDYFDPKMYGPQGSNRAITVFLYLTDVEAGGETQFPRADGKGPTWDFASCNRGLRVRPRKGQVALFYDMKPTGELDPYSLHGGCPVVKGQKWGGTLWLRVPFGGS